MSPTAVIPVGLSEIAERLHVERTTAVKWNARGLLPKPRWTVSGAPAWSWSDIEAWARDTGRLPGDSAETSSGWEKARAARVKRIKEAREEGEPDSPNTKAGRVARTKKAAATIAPVTSRSPMVRGPRHAATCSCLMCKPKNGTK